MKGERLPGGERRDMHSLVLTLLGRDKPGLVDALSTVIKEHGGNWAESRMCHLGGQFAGILRVEVQPGEAAALRRKLEAFDGLDIVVHEDDSSPTDGGVTATLELLGSDRPGIVQQITHALAAHDVNVEEFSSNQTAAPMSGGMLFKASATVRIPASCDLRALEEELETIAADLMFELTLDAGVKA